MSDNLTIGPERKSAQIRLPKVERPEFEIDPKAFESAGSVALQAVIETANIKLRALAQENAKLRGELGQLPLLREQLSEVKEVVDDIVSVLPSTWYADRDVAARVSLLVEQWRKLHEVAELMDAIEEHRLTVLPLKTVGWHAEREIPGGYDTATGATPSEAVRNLLNRMETEDLG